MNLENKIIYQNGAIREFEKPEVCEAIKVANENRLTIYLTPTEWDEREARLKKEYEQKTKSSGSDGDQSKEKVRIICCSASPKADFYYKHVLKEGNPALAESASQFNDALLEEQADKIKRLGKEITRLNKAIHKKNMKIEELRKESSRHLRGKIKIFGENVDLEKMLKDKNAVLSDVAEELRLSKIREKNLTDVCQKYVKENEELKKKLAGEAKRVEMIRNASKEYCDYGVAANEFIKELAGLYVLSNNKGIINYEMLERCKNYQTYGFPANFNRETKKEINDVARGNGNKKPSIFRDDSVGAVTNQKDCSSAKETHPTEDNPDEVELDEILECVRKALEEGHTVSIKYDEADEGGDHYVTWESNI